MNLINKKREGIYGRMTLSEFLSPFENRLADRIILILMVLSISGGIMVSCHLALTPLPISIAAQTVRFLLEQDGTACYGRNTQQNRTHKNEKILINDSITNSHASNS